MGQAFFTGIFSRPRLPERKASAMASGTGFGFDHAGAHFGHARHHFLFRGHGGGAADFGLGLGNEFVGFGLLGLEFGADVFAHVHVGDVDGENFERRVGIEALSRTVLEMRSGFSSTSL